MIQHLSLDTAACVLHLYGAAKDRAELAVCCGLEARSAADGSQAERRLLIACNEHTAAANALFDAADLLAAAGGFDSSDAAVEYAMRWSS